MNKHDYKVVELQNENTGNNEKYVVVPYHEILSGNSKKNFLKRISGKMKMMFGGEDNLVYTHSKNKMGNRILLGDKLLGELYNFITSEDSNRLVLYNDYEKIDNECTELSRALTVIKDNVFISKDGDFESYSLSSDNLKVKNIIIDLDKRIEMQEILPTICESLLLMGDEFEEVIMDTNFLIRKLRWLNQKYMFRNEDEFGQLDVDNAYVLKKESHDPVYFNQWQVVHSRYDHKRGNLYGRSFFRTARRPWRLLQLMENGVVINRLIKAVDRYVFYIPIPKGSGEVETKLIMDQVKSDLKRRDIVDANTGKINFGKATFADDEDFFIATTKDNPAKIERLQGATITGELGDVEYMQNKVIMSTPVPKSYLGLERDVNAKATLSWQDIQYARTIRKIQKEMATFQRKIYDRQLVALGIVLSDDLYTIKYPPVSFVDERMKVEVEQLKWNIVVLANGVNIPMQWLLSEIIGIDEEKIEELALLMKDKEDKERDAVTNSKSLKMTKEKVFNNLRLIQQVNDLRDKITVVREEKLGQQYVG